MRLFVAFDQEDSYLDNNKKIVPDISPILGYALLDIEVETFPKIYFMKRGVVF